MASSDLNPSEIRRRRIDAGLTVRAAATNAGWGNTGFARWHRLEVGKTMNPELATLQAVARTLRCKVKDLLE